ncbi:MAG: hypothetical protein AUK47_05455 [Deltaproteobacteria bacterium CG2_30_63_29]|nr:MAG: hypothetical protein AUK47_05455 [Deltaproteobacteria bacterium CG2_30_63_29]
MTERTPTPVYLALSMLAAATLLLEVSLTRILSVTLWYHFAFMVVSTALFGFGAAGVALSLRRADAPSSDRALVGFAAATPIAFAVGYTLFNRIPFEPLRLGDGAIQWAYLVAAYLAISLPFFLAGLTIAGLFSRYSGTIHRLYLFDLVGAGVGSLGVVELLPLTGGSGTVFVAAALAGAGATALCVATHRRLAALTAVVTLASVAAVPYADRLVPVRISADKNIGGVAISELLSDPNTHKKQVWNSISRVDLLEYSGQGGRKQRAILIDAGTALTRVAHPSRPVDALPPLLDEESFFLGLFDAPEVLVIGSGGGREVVLALRNGAGHVSAVEINPAINEMMTDPAMAEFTGGVFQHPKVELFTDEARSFLRRSQTRYDFIHCPHTISNASMASGALSLAESYLLTLEAFADYRAHLSAAGVLLITRPEAHLPRLFSTARVAYDSATFGFLASSARQFGDSVLAWKQATAEGLSFYAGFVYRAQPFTPAEVERFAAVLHQRHLEPVYLPGLVERAPYAEIARGGQPLSVELPFPAMLEPATDDRPFFNQRVPFSDLELSDLTRVFGTGEQSRMSLEERPVAEAALLVLLIESAAVALLVVLVPLLVFRRRELGGGALRTVGVFGGLGLAYIIVEVGLIQRLNLFLGQPTLVFATVLATLLIGSGLGAGFSARFTMPLAPTLACLLAALVVVLTASVLPLMVDWALAWSAPPRVAVAVGCLFPVGFVMGAPFPLALSRLRERAAGQIPWAWGINGVASVIGSISAIILGMLFGYSAVLTIGVGFYLLAAAAGFVRQSRA